MVFVTKLRFEDIEKLKNMNLAQGGSLDNAIVVKQNKILNKEKLRNEKNYTSSPWGFIISRCFYY